MVRGLTAVFLDPPYADTAKRDPNLYRIESDTVAHDVRLWCLEHGDDPRMRIALCGYEGEHARMPGWSCVPWKAQGGFASQKRSRGGRSVNSHRERIWFSPHCITAKVAQLWVISCRHPFLVFVIGYVLGGLHWGLVCHFWAGMPKPPQR